MRYIELPTWGNVKKNKDIAHCCDDFLNIREISRTFHSYDTSASYKVCNLCHAF